jgi:hypothetical protein
MKKAIFFLLMLVFSISVFGQEPSMAKTDYLHKAKSQNTIAWVLLSSGLAASSIGAVIGMQNVDDYFVDIFDFNDNYEKPPTGAAWMIVGGTMMISSIPLFIASSRNKQRATSAFFKMESQPLVRQGSFIKTSYPAIALKINF